MHPGAGTTRTVVKHPHAGKRHGGEGPLHRCPFHYRGHGPGNEKGIR